MFFCLGGSIGNTFAFGNFFLDIGNGYRQRLNWFGLSIGNLGGRKKQYLLFCRLWLRLAFGLWLFWLGRCRGSLLRPSCRLFLFRRLLGRLWLSLLFLVLFGFLRLRLFGFVVAAALACLVGILGC